VKNKKLQLHVLIPSIGFGGAEKLAVDIAAELQKKGFNVTVIFEDDKSNAEIKNYIILKKIPFCNAGISLKKKYNFKILNLLHAFFTMFHIVKKHSIRNVILHLPWNNVYNFQFWLFRIFRLKVITVFHSTPTVFNPVKGLKTVVNNRNFKLVSVSQNNREVLAQSLQVPQNHINLIYNGINIDTIGKTKDERSSQVIDELKQFKRNNYKIIVTIGRCESVKGLHEFIHAANKMIKDHNDVVFIWIGDGPEREKGLMIADKYQITERLLFTGNVFNVFELLKSVDLMLFPTHMEGLSLALLEAGLLEIPIIASNASSNPEVIEDHKTGLLFHVGDSCDLLDKLRWSIANMDKMKLYACNNKTNVEKNFGFDLMINRYEELINSFFTLHG
jgi:glycosyltransferase involved in cell wall biosynthesis